MNVINSMQVLWIMAGIHAAGFLLSAVCIRLSNEHVSAAHLFWAAFIPIFGPLAAIVLTHSANTVKPGMEEWLQRDGQGRLAPLDSRARVREIVPLEEALLISAPSHRRRLMLSILHADPKAYLDLLLMARFNEDTETAHYAASTVTEIQRQMQLEIQRLKAEVRESPDDFIKRSSYVRQMARYCESGLLEGLLLYRQRCLLQEAIDGAEALGESEELLSLKVENLLALGRGMEAKQTAERMLAKWPGLETAWLEAMRVAVETHDQGALCSLQVQMEETAVDWSRKGRELMAPWLKATQ